MPAEEVTGVDEFRVRLGPCLDRLRSVLIARHGLDLGGDAYGEVSAYAWEHRDRLVEMDNPAGYLYRVSQSKLRRYWRWRKVTDLPPEVAPTELGGGDYVRLHEALAELTADERTVVVLVHAYGYRYGEVAEWMGTSHGTVRNRLHRAMKKLRSALKEEE